MNLPASRHFSNHSTFTMFCETKTERLPTNEQHKSRILQNKLTLPRERALKNFAVLLTLSVCAQTINNESGISKQQTSNTCDQMRALVRISGDRATEAPDDLSGMRVVEDGIPVPNGEKSTSAHLSGEMPVNTTTTLLFISIFAAGRKLQSQT
jgi:hypothetical protein